MKFKQWLLAQENISASDIGKGATPGAVDNPTQRDHQTDVALDKSMRNPRMAQNVAALRTAPNPQAITRKAFKLAGQIATKNPSLTATDPTQIAQGLVTRVTGRPLAPVRGFGSTF